MTLTPGSQFLFYFISFLRKSNRVGRSGLGWDLARDLFFFTLPEGASSFAEADPRETSVPSGKTPPFARKELHRRDPVTGPALAPPPR